MGIYDLICAVDMYEKLYKMIPKFERITHVKMRNVVKLQLVVAISTVLYLNYECCRIIPIAYIHCDLAHRQKTNSVEIESK